MNTDKINYGVPVYVRFGQGRKEKGIILDFTDASQGDYYWTKVELIKENPLSPGQILRQIYPRPIQSYRLTQRTPDKDEVLPTIACCDKCHKVFDYKQEGLYIETAAHVHAACGDCSK